MVKKRVDIRIFFAICIVLDGIREKIRERDIRIFFAICIVALISIMGIWYSTLPEQSEFLTEKRWNADRESNLPRIMEDQNIPALYVYKTVDQKAYVKDQNFATISEPLEQDRFREVLEEFRNFLPDNVDPGFIDYIYKSFTTMEDRYSAALTTCSFVLVEESFKSVHPNVPPIVTDRTEENITVYALSLFRNITRWNVWIMAEDRGEGWVITEDIVNRFIPDSYILEVVETGEEIVEGQSE